MGADNIDQNVDSQSWVNAPPQAPPPGLALSGGPGNGQGVVPDQWASGQADGNGHEQLTADPQMAADDTPFNDHSGEPQDDRVRGWANGLPQPPLPGDTKENVSRLVERLLSKETTYFDHYRLKSLGAKVNCDSGEPGQGEKAKSRPKVFKAKPLSNGQANEACDNATFAVAAKSPPANVKDSPGQPNNASPVGPQDDSTPNQACLPGDAGPATLAEQNKEPKWLSSLKWLTRLFFSFIVLGWVFVLGFIVGRASLGDSEYSWAEGLGPTLTQEASLPSYFSELEASLVNDPDSLPMVITAPAGQLPSVSMASLAPTAKASPEDYLDPQASALSSPRGSPSTGSPNGTAPDVPPTAQANLGTHPAPSDDLAQPGAQDMAQTGAHPGILVASQVPANVSLAPQTPSLPSRTAQATAGQNESPRRTLASSSRASDPAHSQLASSPNSPPNSSRASDPAHSQLANSPNSPSNGFSAPQAAPETVQAPIIDDSHLFWPSKPS
ncbi:MAG: hypothetical protein LBU69_03265, partial [Deltaproteobacteria bacterium]|nr:hypothetical protein [Deltaproteobacteria bacterium]